MIVHQEQCPVARPIRSGEWRDHIQMTDYRSEWLSSLLIERVMWREDAESHFLDTTQIAGPHYIWFRFWLPDPCQVVEKYFSAESETVGIYMPVSDSIEQHGDRYTTTHLVLGLWLAPSGRLTVMGERCFEDAVHREQLAPTQADRAESRIRQLTAEIHRERLPPPLIRNFAIETQDS